MSAREHLERENHYVNTIHMITSGSMKLANILRVPRSRKVYRGLKGMKLPRSFQDEDVFGCKGVVEPSFMSTSERREVALQYAADGEFPCIFEIDVGQVDRGASLSWLSQYPKENEILFPPLSNLEIIGSPRLEKVGRKLVLILSIRLNVNLKCLTR